MTRWLIALMLFVASLGCVPGCVKIDPAPFPPQPVPIPVPPIPVPPTPTPSPVVAVEWAKAKPLFEAHEAGTPVTRKQFQDALGAPWRVLDIQVEPRRVIASWRVAKDGANLNLHVTFPRAGDEEVATNVNLR